jgi:hypothetical protein
MANARNVAVKQAPADQPRQEISATPSHLEEGHGYEFLAQKFRELVLNPSATQEIDGFKEDENSKKIEEP